MTDIELVIKIPEEIYIHLLSRYKYQDTNDIGLSEFGKVGVAIKNGTPLPKEHGWIPVSERLPEDEQEILFNTKTGRVHSGKYYDDNSANQWYSHKDKCRAWNNVVSAWMPLPEPYTTESEGRNDS